MPNVSVTAAGALETADSRGGDFPPVEIRNVEAFPPHFFSPRRAPSTRLDSRGTALAIDGSLRLNRFFLGTVFPAFVLLLAADSNPLWSSCLTEEVISTFKDFTSVEEARNENRSDTQ